MQNKTEKRISFTWLSTTLPFLTITVFLVKAYFPEQIGLFLGGIVPLIFILISVYWFLKANILNTIFSLTLSVIFVSVAPVNFSFIFGLIAIFLIIVMSIYSISKSRTK